MTHLVSRATHLAFQPSAFGVKLVAAEVFALVLATAFHHEHGFYFKV
jgi:hypothetical protein